MSLAVEVGRLASEQIDRNLLPRVRAVGVEVGDRAGVVVGALEFCLEAVLAEPPFEGARPVIEERSGDVLRLAWIEVDEDEEPGGRPAAAGRAGGETGGPRRGPLGDTPLPSEAGPPPGAGDGTRAGSTAPSSEREGTR